MKKRNIIRILVMLFLVPKVILRFIIGNDRETGISKEYISTDSSYPGGDMKSDNF